MKYPKVAILLATYNGEKYLSEQLDSLLRQKFTNNEDIATRICVDAENRRNLSESSNEESEYGFSNSVDYKIYIHDDGSKDNTVSIINDFAERYPDKIIQLNGSSTGGAKNNFFFLMREVLNYSNNCNPDMENAGFPQYFFFCDQDDVWLEDKLQIELTALLKLESENKKRVPALVWCDMKVVDESLNIISDSFSSYSNLEPNKLDLDSCFMHGKAAGCSMACNKELIDMCCEISDTQDIVMHDWVLFLIARIVGRVRYIDKSLILYRQHGDNGIGAQKEGRVKTTFSIIGRILTLQQLKATQVNLIRYIAQIASLKQIEEIYRMQCELIDGAAEFKYMGRIDKVRYVNKYKLYRHPYSGLWASIAAFLI